MDENNAEIDLRPYILTLVQHWRQILAVALGAAILGLVIGLLLPKSYESSATLLISHSRSRLDLAQQFPTLNEPVDTRARMDAMLAIAQSDALAQQVIQGLGEQLPPEQREIEQLKEQVRSTNRGDIILIAARGDDALLAAQIANAWAEQTATVINSAYSGEQPLAEIQNRVQTTKQEYDQSQAALEEFIRNNQINLLEKLISEARSQFDQLSEERSYQIAYYAQRKQTMEDLRVQAETLKLQLQDGSHSKAGNMGDALAVLLARGQALGINLKLVTKQAAQGESRLFQPPQFNFTSQGGVTLNLMMGELQSAGDTSLNYAADLEELIRLADDEIQRAQEALSNLQNAVQKSEGKDLLEELDGQIRKLQTEYEVELSRQRELTSERDLTWNAYQAMAAKEAELRSATQTNDRVILVSRAVPPEKPATHGPIWNTVIGGILGLILGTLVVLAVYWWRSNNLEIPAIPSSN